MPKIELGRIGAVLSPGDDGFVDTAVVLENLGFPSIWLTGGPMTSLDQIAEVIHATQSSRVASGIIAVDRFPADDVIALFTDLEASDPGRFVVGLGGAHRAESGGHAAHLPRPARRGGSRLGASDDGARAEDARTGTNPGSGCPSGAGDPRVHRTGPLHTRRRHDARRRATRPRRHRRRTGAGNSTCTARRPRHASRLPGELPPHGIQRRRHRPPRAIVSSIDSSTGATSTASPPASATTTRPAPITSPSASSRVHPPPPSMAGANSPRSFATRRFDTLGAIAQAQPAANSSIGVVAPRTEQRSRTSSPNPEGGAPIGTSSSVTGWPRAFGGIELEKWMQRHVDPTLTARSAPERLSRVRRRRAPIGICPLGALRRA